MPSLPFVKEKKNFRATYPPNSVHSPAPICAGTVRVWFAGEGGGKADTYFDPEYLSLNTWPVILDSEGEANIYAKPGLYEVSVADFLGVTQFTYEVRL